MSDPQPTHLTLPGLSTSFIGHNILCYPTVGSTMDVARKAAQARIAEGTAMIADEQTAGRGRLRRSWLSPSGSSLALSLVLYPSLQELPRLFMVAGLAAANGIEKATGLSTRLKWPNDVLVNRKKVCGILIENDLMGAAVNWAVVGIGINIDLDSSAYPEIKDVATSLSSEMGRQAKRAGVLECVLEEFEATYLASRRGEAIHRKWSQRLITLGARVQATTGDSIEVGLAESVDPDGSLLLRRDDGSLVRIVAGDVTLRA